MTRVQELQKNTPDLFFRYMCMGKALIDYAEKGDVANFKRLFFESDDYELMFWHIQKAFKAAIKNKHYGVVDFLVNDLLLSTDHEAFQGMIHLFVFNC
mmetsp:Transcript_21383/g.20551  ORF Transcript_21383/g.20551 Transcript_21383/m.20551 type:complete len:98 (+) Transcript_21383:75-368(+)